MDNELRTQEIMNLLNKKKQLSNQALCDLLHCSLSTLRRDLLKLEDRGFVRRTHGGVMLNVSSNVEYSQMYREASNIKAKQAIATIAEDFIGPGMSIFLDSSSSVLQLCKYLKKIPNLVVMTNGLKTALELSEGPNESLKVFMVGGEVKNNSSSVINAAYDSIFAAFQFNLAIFSCRGIDEKGIYEASFSQAKMKKEMMAQAKQTLLLADHTKFNSSHFFKIGDFKDYDAIITDENPGEVYQALCQKSDIDLLW